MMFLDGPPGWPDGALAISQPAHAWVSAQLLRNWAAHLDEAVLLAAEMHDLAWLDWEVAPSFDVATGRPHLFRDVGAALHAPLWANAVEQACAAWGPRVGLLISRHGSHIYTKFADRHRSADADADAALRYVEQQNVKQAAWARVLGLSADTLQDDTDVIAFADTLSLGLCGGLSTPLDCDGPSPAGGRCAYRLDRTAGQTLDFNLSPWPFRTATIRIDAPARAIPGGRFTNAQEMRAWAASPAGGGDHARLVLGRRHESQESVQSGGAGQGREGPAP